MSSSKKLDELLKLKDDPKHPDLSKLLKCSAEFQSELARESGKQSNWHLVVSVIALLVAVFYIILSNYTLFLGLFSKFLRRSSRN